MDKSAVAFLVFWAALVPVAVAGPDRLDSSIDRALAFLHKTQESDGSWQAASTKHAAVTSLAVMAFLSAGHVPGEGPNGTTVDKGVRSVLRMQQANGLIASDYGHAMYHHGISTLMLAQVAGMTDGKLARDVRLGLEKAVKVILKAQRTEPPPVRGGWRYQVQGGDADISVTGWQLLALRAARNLGCDVPRERITSALDYVRRCRDPASGAFCYTPGGGPTFACTGTCILALQICRAEGRDAIQGGAYLLKNPLNWNQPFFFYSVYYGSQAMFQLGKNYWNSFRPQLHKVLLDNQLANGSWMDRDGYGPNYATAMAVLALTVEYRFLPIYQRSEEGDPR